MKVHYLLHNIVCDQSISGSIDSLCTFIVSLTLQVWIQD